MLCAPTTNPGVGAALAIVRFGAETVAEDEAQLPVGEQLGPGAGGLVPPVGSIEA